MDETPDIGPLVGLSEVAEMAGVARPVVSNWRTRDPRFPAPVAELRSGPVFNAEQIARYLKRKRKQMAHVIATINLKGGVGKTTTTVALAEMLSGVFNKKVLVIDLDPQTNATTVLIGEDRWRDLNDDHHTLVTLFRDALRPDGEEPEFDLAKTLQTGVSPVADVWSVDLLPSSLDLIDVQDRLATMPSGRFFSNNPTDLLRRSLKSLIEENEYDYVLIDCPPNLGIITLNGLRLAGGYIIPTIPDVLSTYGIPQILQRVSMFSDSITEPIIPLGIVVTKYRVASTVHVNTVRRMRDNEDLPRVFDTMVAEGNAIAQSAEFAESSTLRQKYGYQGGYDTFRALTEEFIEVVEGSL